jgi:hypothetical protein
MLRISMSWRRSDSLKASGFSEAQARALVDGLQAVVATRQGELATKTDLAELRAELKADLSSLGSKLSGLEARFLQALADQQKWTIGFLVLLLGILFTAIKLT